MEVRRDPPPLSCSPKSSRLSFSYLPYIGLGFAFENRAIISPKSQLFSFGYCRHIGFGFAIEDRAIILLVEW